MAEKTQKPTPKKLRDARKKGQVPKSKEIIATGVLVGLLLAFWAGGHFFMDLFLRLAALAFDFGAIQRDLAKMLGLAESAVKLALVPLLAVAAIELIGGVLIGIAQTRGLVLSFDPLVPKFERLNPVPNAKRLFSLKQLYELVRKLVVVAVFVALITYLFKEMLMPSLLLVYAPDRLIGRVAYDLKMLFAFCALIVLVAALFDYVLQLYEFMKDQKMSIDDIRREHKDAEGDPYIKAHRRAMMRQLATEISAPARTKQASALVTNPTHVAVAVLYDTDEELPRVIAKGRDDEAAAMRQAAREAGVPIMEDPPLARRLYRQVAIDDIVDENLFDAVAVVLAWAEKQRAGQAGAAA